MVPKIPQKIRIGDEKQSLSSLRTRITPFKYFLLLHEKFEKNLFPVVVVYVHRGDSSIICHRTCVLLAVGISSAFTVYARHHINEFHVLSVWYVPTQKERHAVLYIFHNNIARCK